MAIWQSWSTANATTTTSYVQLNNVWNSWNQGTAATGSTVLFNQWVVANNTVNVWRDNAWTQWQVVQPWPRYQVNPAVRAPETPEQRQARAENLFRRVESYVKVPEHVSAKAESTLLTLLSAEQVAEYKERRTFRVRGSRTGAEYRIRHGSSGNVRRLDAEGVEEAAFCAHPTMHDGIGPLPHEDAMIMQALMLQCDEDAFLNLANVHWGSREPVPVLA